MVNTRFVLFTGKGGTGKTSLACATSIALAKSGLRVLLVSTDPASNLDEMLGVRGIQRKPGLVPGVPGLMVLNIDPQEAANSYRQTVLAPYESIKTPQELQAMAESLAGACTVEVAAFDCFAALLDPQGTGKDYDRIIFDTAPTGHTLRLLQLPKAWTEFLASNERGASCLGPHSGLQIRQEEFVRAYKALSSPENTTIALVARPDEASLKEAARAAAELRSLSLTNQVLFINGVFRASLLSDPVAVAYEQNATASLRAIPVELSSLPSVSVPLRPFDTVGIPAISALLDDNKATELISALPPSQNVPIEVDSLETLALELERQKSGLVMVMGKGGVGKTSVAAALALRLAKAGKKVHLSTTDPAAHLQDALAGTYSNLELSRIDPAVETERYKAKVLSLKGAKLSEEGKAFLAEDLRSPCSEEVAVFHAFSRVVFQARSDFVILDTAPTGHTLLLLDATGSYHRDILRSMTPNQTSAVATPLSRLRDPAKTKILLVALPQQTPVTEAAALQEDLRRAQIEPYAWIINNALAYSGSKDPLLRSRIGPELTQFKRVKDTLATRLFVAPWLSQPPKGQDGLLKLFNLHPRGENPEE